MITLAQAKVGMADKVDQMVIDEFRRGSMLLDMLMFDNSVSPGTGGSTLVYGYIKLKTPSTAAFRALNNEYVNNEADREKATAELKIFGGNFKLDRVIINTSGAVDELMFQMDQKIKAAVNLFHYTTIQGDSVANALEYDGLDVQITGTSTEFNTGADIDLSTSALLDQNYHEFLDLLTEFLMLLDSKPTGLLMNSKMKTKVISVARRAGYFTQSEDAFGRMVDNYDGIPLIDLKEFYDGASNVLVVPIDGAGGTTDIYAVVTNEMDGVIGASPVGDKVISTNLPPMDEPGVLKEGDVEMVAAVVVKNTRKAGVFRRIKVQ